MLGSGFLEEAGAWGWPHEVEGLRQSSEASFLRIIDPPIRAKLILNPASRYRPIRSTQEGKPVKRTVE